MMISVLMPAYNAEKYIKDAIESILNQTFQNFEFIIINDGSTDNTASIIKEFAKQDNRIKFINNNVNRGLIHVLNQGLDICTGKYIARMDADDISMPNRLQKQFDFMEIYPNVGLLGTGGQNFGNNNDIHYSPEFVTAKELLEGVPFYHPSVIIRKSILDQYNLKYDKKYYLVEDYELWARMLKYTELRNLQEILIKYRVHDKSESNVNSTLQEKNKSLVKRAILKHMGNHEKIKYYFAEKIFSSKNKSIHKVITIFGIKFSFKSKKLIERKSWQELNDRLNQTNKLLLQQTKKYDSMISDLSRNVNFISCDYNYKHINIASDYKKRVVHFIHRYDITNIGDLSCCPLNYFQIFKNFEIKKHDIYNIDFSSIKDNDIVILGGGGLFNCLNDWNININKLLHSCENVIAWSVGFNTHYDTNISTNIEFDKFKLLTIRDKNHPSNFRYLPCCSCYIDFSMYKKPIIRKIGVVSHKNFRLNYTYPCVYNNYSIQELLSFIAGSEFIITNSYHGWYWSTLMNKKVVLTNKFSSKFDYLPYSPTLYSEKLDFDNNIQNYNNALEECRKLNGEFLQEVVNYITST